MSRGNVIVQIRKWKSGDDFDDSLHEVPADIMAELVRYVRDGADPEDKNLADALQKDFLRLIVATQKSVREVHSECVARWVWNHYPKANVSTFSFYEH